MSDRTALLIYCTAEQAERIRARAEEEHRTVSGYILNIVMRAVRNEEQLAATLIGYQRLHPIERFPIPSNERTTVLMRCLRGEAERIRRAAKERDTTISSFVLRCVERAWSLQ